MTFFSHHPFFTIFCPSVFLYFTHDESYSYFLHTIHPLTSLYTHPHAVFTFMHLALCSRNSEYCIHHLFLLNSSLHKHSFITAHFVHHCTLKQALPETTKKARLPNVTTDLFEVR